jgi:hypothetical protein
MSSGIMGIVLANCIFVLHILVVIILFFGWITPKTRWLWLSVGFTTTTSQMIWGTCPLTIIESQLRQFEAVTWSTHGWGYSLGYEVHGGLVAAVTVGLFCAFTVLSYKLSQGDA